MKCMLPIFGLVVLLAGCQYEVPLTTEHSVPIDPVLLGVWQDNSGKDVEQILLVLRLSDTEYLIHFPTDQQGIYYRGYPVRLGDRTCVQLEVIGTADGPLESVEKSRFHVASYSISNGVLEARLLNKQLVSEKLTSSEALCEAFMKHEKDPDLFTNPSLFLKPEK